MPEARPPRFNHVAMSVPAELLRAAGRQEIIAFYSEVFGWEELPTETIDGKQLVLMAYTFDQFVFLIAEEEPMRAPRLDHFGMGVATLAELDEFLAKARRFQARDSRVDLIDKKTEEHPGLNLTSFYVGYLLPLMVEVQHFEWR